MGGRFGFQKISSPQCRLLSDIPEHSPHAAKSSNVSVEKSRCPLMYRLPSSLTSPGAAATLYSLKSSPLVIFGTCTTARECSRTGTSCWGASGRRLLSGERGVLGLSIASVGLALDRAADHGRRASRGSCHDQITPSRYAIFVHFVSIQGAYPSFLTLCTPVSDKCQSRDSHTPGEVSSQEYPKPTPSIRHEGCFSLPLQRVSVRLSHCRVPSRDQIRIIQGIRQLIFVPHRHVYSGVPDSWRKKLSS